MCNIVSGSGFRTKGQLTTCCCGCSLRAGTLTIGWLNLLAFIGNVISVVRNAAPVQFKVGNVNYSVQTTDNHVLYMWIGSAIISLLLGLFILIGIYKTKLKLVWTAVYLQLALVIWSIVVCLIFFIFVYWPFGLGALISVLLSFYFFLVIRSYAFEAEDAFAPSNPA